eukprot:g782.t1
MESEEVNSLLKVVGIDKKNLTGPSLQGFTQTSLTEKTSSLLTDDTAKQVLQEFEGKLSKTLTNSGDIRSIVEKIKTNNKDVVETAEKHIEEAKVKLGAQEATLKATKIIKEQLKDGEIVKGVAGLKVEAEALLGEISSSEERQKLMNKGEAVVGRLLKSKLAEGLFVKSQEALAGETVSNFLDKTADAVSTAADKAHKDDIGAGVQDKMTGVLDRLMQNKAVSKYVASAQESLDDGSARENVMSFVDQLESGSGSAKHYIQKGVDGLKSIRENKSGQAFLQRGVALLEKHGEEIADTVENLDADSLIQKAEGIITDEQARAQFINQAKDYALEFLVDQIPSTTIPPSEGIKDNLFYTIGKIDMSGFKIKKECVDLALGDFTNPTGGDLLLITVREIQAQIRDLEWSYKQQYFPYMKGNGIADAVVENGYIMLSFGLYKVPNTDKDINGNKSNNAGKQDSHLGFKVKKVGGFSPSANTNGKNKNAPADAKKTRPAFKPNLLLVDQQLSIGALNIKFRGNLMAGIYNVLASVFANSVRSYICSSVLERITENSTWLLDRVNSMGQDYLPLLLEFGEISVNDLPPPPLLSFEAAAPDNDNYIGSSDRGMTNGSSVKVNKPSPVLFNDSSPLGFTFTIREKGPTWEDRNPVRGQYQIVIDRVTASASRSKSVKGWRNNIVPGAIVVACGKGPSGALRFDMTPTVDKSTSLTKALSKKVSVMQKLGRPLVIWVLPPPRPAPTAAELAAEKANRGTFVVSFTETSIGLLVRTRPDKDRGAVVSGFKKVTPPGPAEACGKIKEGQLLVEINGRTTLDLNFKQTVALFKASLAKPGKPMRLRFAWNPDFSVSLKKYENVGVPGEEGIAAAIGLQISELNNYVVVTGFSNFLGAAEVSGKIFIGYAVVDVDGVSTFGKEFKDVIEMIKSASRPLRLGFSDVRRMSPRWELRSGGFAPRKEQEKKEEEEVVEESGNDVEGNQSKKEIIYVEFGEGPLGILLKRELGKKNGRTLVKSFTNTIGPAEKSKRIKPGHVLLGVNGTSINGIKEAEDLLRRAMKDVSKPKVKLHFRDMDHYMQLNPPGQ